MIVGCLSSEHSDVLPGIVSVEIYPSPPLHPIGVLKGEKTSDSLFPSCWRGTQAVPAPTLDLLLPQLGGDVVGADPVVAPAWGIRTGTTEVRVDSVP